MRYHEVLGLWQEGERRLARADPADKPALERATTAIVDELRRRLGGAFSTDELAELYTQGTDWAFDLATRVVQNNPAAWDMPTVAGAAFARYAREASNFRAVQMAEER